jgi:hypothetical protein
MAKLHEFSPFRCRSQVRCGSDRFGENFCQLKQQPYPHKINPTWGEQVCGESIPPPFWVTTKYGQKNSVESAERQSKAGS